jgi:hypothetical protein
VDGAVMQKPNHTEANSKIKYSTLEQAMSNARKHFLKRHVIFSKT